MARIAFTLRMDAEERAALDHLSRIERRPVNQLLNEAVRSYLLRCGPKERSLAASLERLRAYRERDPTFRAARRAFVEAEASVTDALEGTAIEARPGEGRLERGGPVQSKLRGMLSAKLGRG
jgi:predicted transcriptional regulator